MTLVVEKITLFLNDNKLKLDNIIINIEKLLSQYSLNILDTKYNEILTYTLKNITNSINYNFRLYSDCIKDIKTKTTGNKLNIFIKKIMKYILLFKII